MVSEKNKQKTSYLCVCCVLACAEAAATRCADRREVYRQLRSIYPSLACRQFLDSLQQLEQECGYGEEAIPQLRDVSAFLRGEAQRCTAAAQLSLA